MLNALLAAAAAVAGLANKASKDAEDAEAQKRARALHKQQAIAAILGNRAQAGGVDTSRSAMAANEADFLRQLAASQRDTSTDFVPFVNALGGVAQGIASDVARAPAKQSAPQPGALKPMFDQYGNANNEDEQSFLMRVARSGKGL